MKICFCVDSMNAGGAERVVATLANEFAFLGHDVSIIMVSSLRKEVFYNVNKSVNIILLQNNEKRINSIKRIIVLRNLFKKNNFDVAISFLTHINIYTHLATRGLKIKHIVSERNDPSHAIKSSLVRWLKMKAFKSATGCVFQTKDAADYYKQIPGFKKNVIHNPLNLSENNSNLQKNKREKTVIFVGRLISQKNIFLLLEAFKKFLDKYPMYKLKIYGEGDQKESINNFIKVNKNENKIKLMGVSNSWHKDENNAGMFVLPSDYEGMPNALMEAMFLGIPCISTDCPIGGPKELIQNGTNGILVPTGNIEEMVTAMENIASDEELTIKFANRNKELISLYTPRNIANEWLKFINKIKL